MPYARQTAGGIALLSGGTIESTNTFERDGEQITEPTQFSFETMLVWTDAERAAHGIYPVVDDAIPAGKVVTSSNLEFDVDDQVIHRRWTLADVSIDSLKARKREAIEAHRDALLAGGFTVPQSASAALAGKVLQTRDSDDRTNWLVSQASYSAAVAAGSGATVAAKFRSADNVTVTISYAEGLDVLLAMAAWGAAVMDHSWALKDALAAAADAAAVDAIGIEADWPA
jgi:hypothetical protein